MAVLSQYRGRGIGTAILEALLDLAQSQGIRSLSLHSQVMAIPFYEKRRFIAHGPVYEEAGIPHRNMILLLPMMVQ
jgi:predicted GNAT family N-acyltransferase